MNTNPGIRRGASCPSPGAKANADAKSKANSLTEQQKRQLRQNRFFNKPKDTNAPKKVDPKTYGFVSRGEDSRLRDSEPAQREYFDWILETFKQVEKAESASISTGNLYETDSSHRSSASSEQMLSSLRKLREALLHQRPSEFSKRVHLFSVRVSSAVGHYQTYIPSIQYLLDDSAPLISAAEKVEIASLLVLHASHCNNRNSEAWRVFFEYLDPHKHSRVFQTLSAWTAGDYHAWMDLYNSESDHSVFAIMSMGASRMIAHMVECLGGAFFTYSYADLKRCMPKGVEWEEFKTKHDISWELEDNVVHIRRRKKAGGGEKAKGKEGEGGGVRAVKSGDEK